MKRLTLVLACFFYLSAANVFAQQAGSGESQSSDSNSVGSSFSETEKIRKSPNTAPGGQMTVVAPSKIATVSGTATPCASPSSGIEIAVVIKPRANLRKNANISGEVVGDVKKDSTLVIEEYDGPGSPWYRVTDVLTGKRGWIHGDVIKIAYKK